MSRILRKNKHFISDIDTDQQTSIVQVDWNPHLLSSTYIPPTIPCRQVEKKTISEFIYKCVRGQLLSRVLYISGVPGVGKTACVNEVLTNIGEDCQKRLTHHYINAYSINSPAEIYTKLLKLLNVKRGQSKADSAQQALLSLNKTLVLFIDEVDCLLTKNQQVLYNLFEWACQICPKFALIVVANRMDFPQQLSTKICSRMGQWRVVFKPYSAEQIHSIVSQRLDGCEAFEPETIRLFCRKMASQGADLRFILNVLERAYQNKKQSVALLKEVYNALHELSIGQEVALAKQAYFADPIIKFIMRTQSKEVTVKSLRVLFEKDVTKSLNESLATLAELGLITVVNIQRHRENIQMVKLVCEGSIMNQNVTD